MRHPRGQSEQLHITPIEIGVAILAQTNDASKTPALKTALLIIPAILHSLKDLEETARDITGISKALAAIPILEYAQTNNVTTVAKTPPHIRRYFEQFYNNQFEKVRPFFNHISAKLGISTDKKLAHIRIQLEEKISELLAQDPAPTLKRQFQQLQNALQELAADPTVDKSNVHLDDLVKDSEDICAIFSAFGTHYKTCQSRLPAEWVGEAAKDVLAIELGAKVPETTSEAALIRLIVDRMIQNPNERIVSDLLSANKTSQMVVDFFKMTRIANKTFPHINWQIMANYTSPVEFLGAYYLALRTGAITIENGNVTSSSIRIMELSESAAQVANYFKTVGHIHTVPLIRQLTQQSLGHFGPEFGTKIATSDTTRDIGQLLGQS
ncbi:hypothetical protein EBR57_09950, partial [bacterium]|nr:hypothetical protein [bacterium]